MATAPVPGPTRLRVLLASDQALVADTVRTALGSRGHEVVDVTWPGDVHDDVRQESRQDLRHEDAAGAMPEVGLLLCEDDQSSRVQVAASIVTRISVPWVALVSASGGRAEEALSAAGVQHVLPAETGLDQVGDLLVSVGLHHGVVPARLP